MGTRLVKIIFIAVIALLFIGGLIYFYTKSKPTPETNDYPAKEEWYPKYHLAPPTGWMNDPNGLISFNGYYHAFYQHNPAAPIPENICWGHARSKNMIQWEHLPTAISPSIKEDKDGCWSGSAVIDGGTMKLLYTGRSITDKEDQVQCLATSNDTINFTKHGKVLDPPENSPDFRDPKLWREGYFWYMVTGFSDHRTTGKVFLFKSSNLRQWEYLGVLATADLSLGFVWECPDFFQLGDKYVLLVSPQGIKSDGYNYPNRCNSGYLVGTWKPLERFNIQKSFTESDAGHDFYASQTFLAPDGRRILIAWMGMWDSPVPEDKQNWAGMMTLPRELSLSKDNNLIMKPVHEVESLRHHPVHITKQVLKKEHIQLDDFVTTMEITMTWNLAESDAEKYGLRVGDTGYREGGVYLYVDNQSKRLVLDRRYPQYGLSGYRSIPLVNLKQLSLRVFFDQSSMEVFVNDGVAYMTSRIYPRRDQRSLSLFADNGVASLEESSRWLLG